MVSHVSAEKKSAVKEFKELVAEYPIVGVVNMEGMPTRQVQIMRATLRDQNIVLRMTKKRLIKIILKESGASKAGIEALTEKLPGMPAMIFAKDNPFKLYKQLQKSKSPAPAKAGSIAPNDIVVPAGPTGFAPGPIISELGSFGVKAGIDAGKVVVKADSTVAKEGDIISGGLAAVLTRLGITPLEIGLDLVQVYEDGNIFDKNVLAIDEDKFMADLTQAHQWAFNLSVEAGIINSANAECLIGKAVRSARNLAVESTFMADEVVDIILAKGASHGQAIKQITD